MARPTWLHYLPTRLQVALQRRPGVLAALHNISWLASDRLLQIALGLTVGVWVARYLGPEQYGLLSFALAIVAIFSTVTTMGVESIVVRDLVRRPLDANGILGSALAIQLVGGLVACLLSVGLALLVRPDDPLARIIVAIIGFGLLFRASEVVAYWFEAQVRSKYAVLARNAAFVATSALKAGLVLIGAPLVAFAWISLVGAALTGLALWIAWRNRGSRMGAWRADARTIGNLLAESWPLVLSGFAVMIQARIDQILLARMVGDNEVGQYSAAMQLIEAIAFVPVIIVGTVAPYIARAKMLDEALYRDWLTNIYRLMLLVFLAIAGPVFLLSGWIVEFLFGDAYARAGWLLALFSLRLFFANFGIAKRLFLTNESLFRYSLLTAVIGTFVNVGLNLVLIPVYRAEGAFVASIVSFAITIFAIDAWHPVARENLKLMLAAIASPHRLRLRKLRAGQDDPGPRGIEQGMDNGYP